jgi:hypothetical protein
LNEAATATYLTVHSPTGCSQRCRNHGASHHTLLAARVACLPRSHMTAHGGVISPTSPQMGARAWIGASVDFGRTEARVWMEVVLIDRLKCPGTRERLIAGAYTTAIWNTSFVEKEEHNKEHRCLTHSSSPGTYTLYQLSCQACSNNQAELWIPFSRSLSVLQLQSSESIGKRRRRARTSSRLRRV